MKKEILFAVSLGLVVGLIITFGVYRAQQAMKNASTVNSTIADTISQPPSPSTSPTSQNDAFLVTEPKDESLVAEAAIHVSGQTFPNAAVVIIGVKGEIVGTSDDKGNFSIPFTLQPGANVITVRVLSDDHDTVEVLRNVVLSTADLTATPVASASATAKPTATPKATKKPTPSPTSKGK